MLETSPEKGYEDQNEKCETCTSSCDYGWEEKDGRCYFWSKEKLSWEAAEEKCQKLGGHLASVISQDVHVYLRDNEKNSFFVWIGATDQKDEGIWKWTDCNPWNFAKWGKNEPDNGKTRYSSDDENCAVLTSKKYSRQSYNKYEDWSDTSCKKPAHFVCARPICGKEVDCLNPATKGADYTGKISKTKSGRDCQMWSSSSPHVPYRDFGSIGDHNYCRNPDNEEGPWCYTTDPNKRWEFCDVPICVDCLNPATKGADYTGKISKTKSGRDCQMWSSTTPHKPYGRWGSIGDHNYCRNPDKAVKEPWCYTTDPKKRWEYC